MFINVGWGWEELGDQMGFSPQNLEKHVIGSKLTKLNANIIQNLDSQFPESVGD